MPRPRRMPALVIRITHWIGAPSMLAMIGSGWQIYNASPILPFTFPPWMTLGGWLARGIAWHLRGGLERDRLLVRRAAFDGPAACRGRFAGEIRRFSLF